MVRFLLIFTLVMLNLCSRGQQCTVSGFVTQGSLPMVGASVELSGTNFKTVCLEDGSFKFLNIPAGLYNLQASNAGYRTLSKKITVPAGQDSLHINIELDKQSTDLADVVITGTQRPVTRAESLVPVESYNAVFFNKNPTSCLFDALQNVNGVRPQLNCNICNTGDIHINGLEGPYTMILIDGMPIVSSLSTVYGLSGIPTALIERVEIVKGPASSLYGSEAVGGLINVITKNPAKAPLLSFDVMTTSWQEANIDLGFKNKIGKKITVLTGLNAFLYDQIIDRNKDLFTDVTLQKRLSIFQKWEIKQKNEKAFSLAARYFTEDRWGGDVRWNKSYRGGDSIYGESIYTNRAELISKYQLPIKEKITVSGSFNVHQQNNRYGTTSYIALQRIAFLQAVWDKSFGKHDVLGGLAARHTFYNDNTVATARAESVLLPGIFLQDEIAVNNKHKLLFGIRADRHPVHKTIITPRFAYKWAASANDIIRLNAGTGFRVVNVFTEEHAALTGARQLFIPAKLLPEKTYNVNLNYLKQIFIKNGSSFTIDYSMWYTYFNNRIIPDYETDANKIIYNNLNGFAESKGITANVDYIYKNKLSLVLGATLMDVNSTENAIKTRQILTEYFTGTWALSYKMPFINLAIDYTGNLYSPMRLPLAGPLDPRKPYSPWWSIQNIQFNYSGFKNISLYAGIKNLLNFLPTRNNPFLIARSNDPFDKEVEYDPSGSVMQSATNPYALSFDPTYVYAPNQGIRGFIGVRYKLR